VREHGVSLTAKIKRTNSWPNAWPPSMSQHSRSRAAVPRTETCHLVCGCLDSTVHTPRACYASEHHATIHKLQPANMCLASQLQTFACVVQSLPLALYSGY
jgi:hypothetical protein